MSNKEWLERDDAALASVLPRCSDIVGMRGRGSWLYDVEWTPYLDFTCGIAVTNIGHCHPKVVDAIKLQAETLIHTSVVTHNRPTIELAEELGRLTPFFIDPQVFFCNSGAEAVDGALKLARIATGKPGVIAFQGAFHGRTIGGTSLTTAKPKYREGYDPLLPGVFVYPYGETLPIPRRGIDFGWVGAVVVEPVLGEGGYVLPPEGWLQHLREYCDQHKLLLVFDEVQTGMGRTGYPFAAETFGVTPDILLFAKGVASGLPLGGIISSRPTFEKWETGKHGSTFGGNPVACAAALATIDVLAPLYESVRTRGAAVLERLRGSLPVVVRGVGFMIGIEFVNTERAEAVQQHCLDNGLLVLTCGPDNTVIRLIPPLNISDEDLDAGLTILERAVNRA